MAKIVEFRVTVLDGFAGGMIKTDDNQVFEVSNGDGTCEELIPRVLRILADEVDSIQKMPEGQRQENGTWILFCDRDGKPLGEEFRVKDEIHPDAGSVLGELLRGGEVQ